LGGPASGPDVAKEDEEEEEEAAAAAAASASGLASLRF